MIYYGDEYAMPGANDPDCRRGMYWDEEYQDKEMFEWYKRLLQVRKAHTCIVEGELAESITRDEDETIVLIRKNGEETIALIFNCSNHTKEFKVYFVTDHQDSILITDLTDSLHELLRGKVDSTLSLKRL